MECSMPISDRRQECIGHIQGVLHVPQKNGYTQPRIIKLLTCIRINLTNNVTNNFFIEFFTIICPAIMNMMQSTNCLYCLLNTISTTIRVADCYNISWYIVIFLYFIDNYSFYIKSCYFSLSLLCFCIKVIKFLYK